MNNLATIGHNAPPSEIEIVSSKLIDKSDAINQKLKSILPCFDLQDDDEKGAGKITEAIKAFSHIKRDVEATHKDAKAPYLECGKVCDAWKREQESLIDVLRAPYEESLKSFLSRKEERARLELAAREAAARAEAMALAEAARLEAEALVKEAADSESIADTSNELLTAAIHKEQEANMLASHAENVKSNELAKARSAHGAASASQSTVWIGEVESYITIDLEPIRAYLPQDAINKAVAAYVRVGGRQLRGAKIYQTTKLNVR